ncbi:hypothetical protein RhiirA5_407916 [Rhizophagus irregularis]|uniref:Uncharacterized protein n=1 Tax=Rhizophagus irregularis TaxID=588596 RepID=A0A2I1ET28_9GLOM|nr:hypothetical protein RhiirA5_407916 [Rhizophagus irregularis]PKC59386.1 hypothetical protein RhiirA1_469517 [Rhizophagus irregularis]PKC64968.1 hypothetical protein RhiirA1_461683 [Rhizophagus irregularis]PKY25283.1 hypothetical protein RhiirB3_440164 [Rhizophagus irregularis]
MDEKDNPTPSTPSPEQTKGFRATYEKSEGEKVARDGKESSNFPINKLQTQSSDKIPETEEVVDTITDKHINLFHDY